MSVRPQFYRTLAQGEIQLGNYVFIPALDVHQLADALPYTCVIHIGNQTILPSRLSPCKTVLAAAVS